MGSLCVVTKRGDADLPDVQLMASTVSISIIYFRLARLAECSRIRLNFSYRLAPSSHHSRTRPPFCRLTDPLRIPYFLSAKSFIRHAIPDAETVGRSLTAVNVSLACMQGEPLVIGGLHMWRRRAMTGAITANRVNIVEQS